MDELNEINNFNLREKLSAYVSEAANPGGQGGFFLLSKI